MQELKLELYQGPINPAFSNLPGYTIINNEMYWAVLMARPPDGSAMANWIKAETPSTIYPEGTNGTDTLQAGTTNFIVSEVCVKHPKYPPYKYYPAVPNGPGLGPLPIGSGDGGYYCVTPPPDTEGIGIWIISLEKFGPGSPELPVAPPGGRAVFLPNDLSLTSQPLLIVRGEVPGGKRCPKLGDISSDKDCYAPGETGVFTIAIPYDPDNAIGGYTWEFKNIDTGQINTISSQTNSVSVTFDNTWEVGNWTVKVSVVLVDADPICGYSMAADNIYPFGLLELECPVIDYLDADQDPNNPCRYEFEVRISGDYSGTKLQWNFGDGTTSEQVVTSSVMTTPHVYSNVPANGALVSAELVEMNVCCPRQFKERWIQLPPDGCGVEPRCECTPWVDGECVDESHRRQVRTCTPAGCDSEERIIHDASCARRNGPPKKVCCENSTIWLAAILLGIGLFLLAISPCFPTISGWLMLIGGALILIWFILMTICVFSYIVRLWLSKFWPSLKPKCEMDLCEVIGKHAVVLGILTAILTLLGMALPCVQASNVLPPLAFVTGILAAVSGACNLRSQVRKTRIGNPSTSHRYGASHSDTKDKCSSCGPKAPEKKGLSRQKRALKEEAEVGKSDVKEK